MSNESNNQPPQYIITTPSEVDSDEVRSLNELENAQDAPGTVVVQCETSTQQHQRRVVSQMSRQIASRSFSIASASNSILEEGSSLDAELQKQLQQMQSQQQQIFTTQKTIATSTRSQSLQSSSVTGATGELALQLSAAGGGNSLTTSQLGQQLKAQSSTSIMSSEQRMGFMQKTSSTSSSTSTKSKFQSFLQQPEAVGHPASGSGAFLTAHQKHVRQFVRSTSAHSEAAVSLGSSRPDKCIRSASTQIDEPTSTYMDSGNGDHLTVSTNKLGLHQSSSILISKSAETIEMKSSSQTSSAGMRTQLTLSGGLLAPPNRKITILSPIHAPPGLHDMLKRAGRSPLSPRISFPGSEADLFG
ncbi:cAMP-specific 3',5'-cyclic phosphodiesterase-like [Lucilia cuprina]|uniref:cAMP-specific 3',5'-cyclic phosphodiesterase-like n=1 Tax=Lucilia cuprina TaxID=7375 RepID=UPI001F06AC56|nr:cAMP-specific 3',5'-cyclic phosphodiesterase-like [Lucilia cuprina]